MLKHGHTGGGRRTRPIIGCHEACGWLYGNLIVAMTRYVKKIPLHMTKIVKNTPVSPSLILVVHHILIFFSIFYLIVLPIFTFCHSMYNLCFLHSVEAE